jgi:hypothetical protein
MSSSGFFGHKELSDTRLSENRADSNAHVRYIFTHSHIRNNWPYFEQQNTRSEEAFGDLPSNGDCISQTRKVVCVGHNRH